MMEELIMKEYPINEEFTSTLLDKFIILLNNQKRVRLSDLNIMIKFCTFYECWDVSMFEKIEEIFYTLLTKQQISIDDMEKHCKERAHVNKKLVYKLRSLNLPDNELSGKIQNIKYLLC